MKDYYKVLGVSSKATKSEIKKAFHTLAKKYHPDINKGDKFAEERFKEVSEAYEVLGNDEKKREYDDARIFGSGFDFGGFSENGPFGSFYKKYNKTRQNYYNSKSSNTNYNTNSQSSKSYSYTNINEDEEDSNIFKDFINSFEGTPFEGISSVFDNVINKAKSFTASVNKGDSTNSSYTTLKIPLKVALTGGKVQVTGLPGGIRDIDIPANTLNNTKIDIGPYKLNVVIENDEHFVVVGNNIKTTLALNIAQAVLGGKVRFTDPRGNSVILVIPVGTKHGDKVKLSGLGIAGGDLFVEFDVMIPKNLTDEQRRIFSDACNKIGLKH